MKDEKVVAVVEIKSDDGNAATILIAVVIALVFLGAAVTVALSLGKPDQMAIIIPTLLGLIAPVVLGLMAVIYASKSVTVARKAALLAAEGVAKIDSGMDEVKSLIRAAAFAEGKAEGRAEQKIEGGATAVVPAGGIPPVQAESVTIDAVNVNIAQATEKAEPPAKPGY